MDSTRRHQRRVCASFVGVVCNNRLKTLMTCVRTASLLVPHIVNTAWSCVSGACINIYDRQREDITVVVCVCVSVCLLLCVCVMPVKSGCRGPCAFYRSVKENSLLTSICLSSLVTVFSIVANLDALLQLLNLRVAPAV